MGASPGFPALWPAGDCPDFFALPRICDGCGEDRDTSEAGIPTTPTHVFKHSLQGGVGDVYQLGRWLDPVAANSPSGSWTSLGPFLPADLARDVHNGSLVYASKSFLDTKPSPPRRIWFGGVSIGSMGRSALTLPREITYNPTFRVLQFAPIPELRALRGPSALVDEHRPPSNRFYGGGWPGGGRMLEMTVTFARASGGVGGGGGGGGGGFGVCLGVPSAVNATCPVRLELSFTAAGDAVLINATDSQDERAAARFIGLSVCGSRSQAKDHSERTVRRCARPA